MTVVPFDTFEVLFSSPVVRVGLNFELLRDAGAVVTLQAVTDSDVLSGWSLPWYHRPDGTPCRFDVVGARPCTVREAADRAVTLNSYIDAAVDMYADTLCSVVHGCDLQLGCGQPCGVGRLPSCGRYGAASSTCTCRTV